MKKIILALSLFAATVFAHEGEHGPSTVQAPKGGVMRSLETVHLELVNERKKVKIYVYDIKVKPADVAQYAVSATVTLPKKKPETIKLVEAGDHWEADIDSKNSHRYTLILDIKQGGHEDKIKWVVEPKK